MLQLSTYKEFTSHSKRSYTLVPVIELHSDHHSALVSHDVHDSCGSDGRAHVAAMQQQPLPQEDTQEGTHQLLGSNMHKCTPATGSFIQAIHYSIFPNGAHLLALRVDGHVHRVQLHNLLKAQRVEISLRGARGAQPLRELRDVIQAVFGV